MSKLTLTDRTREVVPPATRFVDLPNGFHLKRGGVLQGGRIAYETLGRLAADGSNAVLVLGGFSANAHVASHAEDMSKGWWEQMVGPGKAVFTVDVRSPVLAKLDMLHAEVATGAARIAGDLNVGIAIEPVERVDLVTFDPELVSFVRQAAHALGTRHMDLVSGAGHDACWLARVVPSTMNMCPCVGGLSHNEAEEISAEWAEAGANVLLQATLSAAVIQN